MRFPVNKRSQKIAFIVIALVLVLILITYLYKRDSSPIPNKIREKISFAIMVPDAGKAILDKKTVRYDDSKKVLSFVNNYNGTNLIVSEQAFPDQFVDVPEAYDKFLQQVPTITSFEVINGKVNLGKPASLKGLTLAIMNGKGTFIFVRPQKHDLNEDRWKSYFNSFEIIK